MLDSEKYARTQELAETARDFCDKVAQLSDTVATVVDAVDRQVRLASFFFRGRRGSRGDERNSVCRFFFSRRRDGDLSGASSPPSPRDGAACSARSDETRVAYRPRRFLSLTRAPCPCVLNRTPKNATRKAAATEREKLRAVGKRNQAAAESERRRRDSAVKSAAARERRRELERLQVEYESLLRVKAEQEALIARMSGGA